MKKKFILPTLIAATTTLPSLGIVGCSDYQFSQITQEVLDEFRGNEKLGIAGLNSVPRPSNHHDLIVAYLKNRIKTIADCGEDDIHVDDFGNMYYDIEPTSGFTNKPSIIIQAHTDMIVAGMSAEEALTKPIETVIEGNLVHSKDYATSIGADNGIGVSIALYLLKHRNDFNHGRIRLLLTADEDAGMVGASKMDADWLKDPETNDFIPWLINVDAENLGTIYRSCCGNARIGYKKTFSTVEAAKENVYELTIDGLNGGHSAIDITKGRANADKLAFNFLMVIASQLRYGYDDWLQIIKFNHEKFVGDEPKDIQYSPNQIIANSRLIFATSFDEELIKKQWIQFISLQRTQYPGEDWDKIILMSHVGSYKGDVGEFSEAIDTDADVIQIIRSFALNSKTEDDVPNSFYFGVLKYREPQVAKNPLVSANVGPIKIDVGTSNNMILEANTSTRSGIEGTAEAEPLSIDGLVQTYSTLAENCGLAPQPGSVYYPWPFNGKNTLVDYLSDGYKRFGVKPDPYDDPAGVEPAWWHSLSEGKTICACLGPTIDGAHSVNETLHLDTIDPVVNNILYTIDKLMNR